eukprot:TRINITY_DN5_c0_g5_i6.p1 TRINITY_DN5_c0_g5~~TRINITY_DN5_c0_g5_i6.p1  ORF type:complete len:317 (-),score=81.31 TRINITY_DN5_c0_g5_i6:274-1224(-)
MFGVPSPPLAELWRSVEQPRIIALRDERDGALALLLHVEQYVVATVPFRGELHQHLTPHAVYQQHLRTALLTLYELRHNTRRVRVSAGVRVPWWLRNTRRKLLTLALLKMALLCAAYALVSVTRAWHMLRLVPAFSAQILLLTALHAHARGGATRRATNFVQCALRSAGYYGWAKWMQRVHIANTRDLLLMTTCSLALLAALFWNGPRETAPPCASALWLSVHDGLLGTRDTCGDHSATPLREVRAIRAIRASSGRDAHFVQVLKRAPLHTDARRVPCASIAQRIAHALHHQLQRWHVLHNAPCVVHAHTCTALAL